MKLLLRSSILLLAVIGLTNCSKGSVQQSTGVTPDTSQGSQGDGTGVVTPPAPIDSVDLKGSVDSNDSNNNLLSFDFDKTHGEFIVMVPMPQGLSLMPSGSFTNFPDIRFSSIFDPLTGKTKFGVRIPVKYIIKGSSFLPPTHLPNGDDLPRMPAGMGELPSLALNFPQHDNTQMTLYLGVNAICLFVTLPDNIAFPIGFSLPIKNKTKKITYGFLTFVPKKGTYAPGLFVSTLVPNGMAKILEDYFHL